MPETNQRGLRFYDLYGFKTAISTTDPLLSEALHARLRYFSSSEIPVTDLRFQFSFVPEDQPWRIQESGQRVVYESPGGTVTYSDRNDILNLTFQGSARVRCLPKKGLSETQIRGADQDRVLWLATHPLFTIPLLEILKCRDIYGLHAAALCLGNRALLIPGAAGSGKSTLTLALARAGFGFLGDDLTFLRPSGQFLRILAFPDEIDVTDYTAALFPELGDPFELPQLYGARKRQVRPETVYGTSFVPECDPYLLAFPRIGENLESRLEPMDKADALLELAPNVLLTDARSSQAHLDAVGELVRCSHCYRLEAGRDFDRLPGLFRDLMG